MQSPVCRCGTGLNGCTRICAEQNLLGKRNRVYESLSSRQPGQKSFILTIYWNLAKPVKIYPWNHCTPTPHRSETNGIAERAVRRVKEGTSAVLLQSGLDEKLWVHSMHCYCYLRDVQDLLSDGKTPHERRFGEPFNGPTIPFGSMIEYHPISAKRPVETPPVW